MEPIEPIYNISLKSSQLLYIIRVLKKQPYENVIEIMKHLEGELASSLDQVKR